MATNKSSLYIMVFKIHPLRFPWARLNQYVLVQPSEAPFVLLFPFPLDFDACDVPNLGTSHPLDSYHISGLSFARNFIYVHPNHNLLLQTFYFFPLWSEGNAYRCLSHRKLQAGSRPWRRKDTNISLLFLGAVHCSWDLGKQEEDVWKRHIVLLCESEWRTSSSFSLAHDHTWFLV